jgi:transcriptional regulator with XRE-family HTH domain
MTVTTDSSGRPSSDLASRRPPAASSAAPSAALTAAGTGSNEPDARETDRLRRRELADFLRNRRERISPEQIGLPTSGRRRTPGLRREEVAQLAGVGVTWYTWLEQSREIHASPQVLDAIARTLMLDAHERSHLFRLAGSPLPDSEAECNAVHPAVHLLLDELDHIPAVVSNARKDALAHNAMFEAMTGGFHEVGWDERNILWQIFTNREWRSRLVDWDTGAPRMVAQFRAAMAEHVGEPAWTSLVSRLRRASPEFSVMWARHDVEGPETRTKRILHPSVGLLRLDYTYLWLGPRGGNRMVTYTPADEESAARLARLHEVVQAAA